MGIYTEVRNVQCSLLPLGFLVVRGVYSWDPSSAARTPSNILRICGCEIPHSTPYFYLSSHCLFLFIRLFCTQMDQFRAYNHHLFPTPTLEPDFGLLG